jgi:hypothetical protein
MPESRIQEPGYRQGLSKVRIDPMVGEHQARPYASHQCSNA